MKREKEKKKSNGLKYSYFAGEISNEIKTKRHARLFIWPRIRFVTVSLEFR